MKKEAKILLEKALDSLVLSIEHFNRPWDKGRSEAVLILLDRSFELLLKAAIVYNGGRIREKRARETFGFDKCVRVCFSNAEVKCLDEEQALTVQIINSLRDAAQHYILSISQQQLYLYTQAGVTLFAQILQNVFGHTLTNELPERVLPISTKPPQALDAVINAEFEDIKKLLQPGLRKGLQARSKLRALAIVESSLRGERSQPSKSELMKISRLIQSGKDWTEIFPGVASLSLDTSGTGLNVSIRLTKNQGEAVHLVPEGTPGATVIAVKRVSELSYYSLGLHALAQKVGLSWPKCLAAIKELRIQESNEYFKTFKIGSQQYKRYSPKALDILREQVPKLNMGEVWKKHNPRATAG